MKKIVALALVLVMVLGLMAGCGEKPMDAVTLAKKMDEASKNLTDLAAKMGMELDFSLAMPGMTMDMGLAMDMDMQYKMDMSASYTAGTMTVDAMGMTEQTRMESYMTMEGDKLVSYTYDAESEMWLKTEEDLAAMKAQMENLMGMALKLSDIPAEKMVLAEEQETVDGKSCYVLTVTLDGSYVQDGVSAVLEALPAELEEMDLSGLKDMDLSAMTIKTVFRVDAATFRPVQMDLEILGMGEVLNGLMGELMSALAGEESAEMTVDVPKCVISMKQMRYEDVAVPAVPQDALDNAVTEEDLMGELEDWEDTELEMSNPPQADGSFLMSMGQTGIRIVLPEGNTALMSETEFLSVMTDDYAVSVTYIPVPDYTAADMLADFQLQVDAAKEEDRWLADEVIEGPNGFTVANMSYNDGVYEVMAWKEIPGGLMVVSGSSFEYLPQMDAYLSAIEIAVP